MEREGGKVVGWDKVEDFFVTLDRIMVRVGWDVGVGRCCVCVGVECGSGGLVYFLFHSCSFRYDCV